MTDNTFDESAVEDFLEDFLDKARLGQDIELARAKMYRRSAGQEDSIDEAYDRARRELNFTDEGHQIGAYKREREGKNWYVPKIGSDIFWPPLRKSIHSKLGAAVEDVDITSTHVLNGLRPVSEDQNTKGLVLGYVQSGKTTNFISVIAKAADAGYRLIIVLTGITENLRRQTQERINADLIDPQAARWTLLTDIDSDFSGDRNISKLSNVNERFIAVVKKNSSRLKRLNQWLADGGNTVDGCPILVIDDESDQASIDVSPSSKAERSAINRQINNLLEHDKTAYIAYSATPFANILIDPTKLDDLYPSDFIITLPEPKGYFGSRALFGREPLNNEDPNGVDTEGLDMIRIIPDDEVEGIRPGGKSNPDKQVVGGEALRAAIRWFIMATAARQVRGQGNKHSSMLIHTSMLTADHEELKFQVDHELTLMKKELRTEQRDLSDWQTQWETETALVPAEDFGLDAVSFDQVEPLITEVLENVALIVDNGKSVERLDYSNGPTTVIAIGGNTLSRGLTLEGLVTSYFVRRASAYDTLLQMGRWFGFRNGYQDLPRIWMPEELNGWFHDLSTVETELREELDVYLQENMSPMEVQAKIRLHPAMMITSRAKMQDAIEASVSFSGKKEQTIKFKELDQSWLDQNQSAVKRLISAMQSRGVKPVTGVYESPVYLNVPGDLILDFMNHYAIHEETRLGNDEASALKKYIAQETNSRRIRRWNVSVITQNSDSIGSIDLGIESGPVHLISRAKLANSAAGEANIKALVTTTDRLNDVVRNTPEERAEFRKEISEEIKGGSRESLTRKLHDKFVGAGIGHLAIYPISKDSQPRGRAEDSGATGGSKKAHRHALDAVDHVMGLGIFFPTSNAAESQVSYVSAARSDEAVQEQYSGMDEEIKEINADDEAALEQEEAIDIN